LNIFQLPAKRGVRMESFYLIPDGLV
jgi:hypothetical protein